MKDTKNTIRIAALTNVGMERDHNEDNFLVGKDLAANDWLLTAEPYLPGPKGALLIVADGMGGTNAGEVASAIAIEAIQEYYANLPSTPPIDEAALQDIMKDSVLFANNKLIEHAKANRETRGMGTTLIMSWIIGNCAYTCWSGDSRAYIFRKGQGIRQISKDHSFVQQLVDKGSITEEQAFYHPDSNIITQSLGDSKRLPDPDFIAEPLQDGDIILLCSDGLNGMLQDKDIENILIQNPDIEASKEVLIADANKAGGHDNITVVLAEMVTIAAKPVPSGKYKNSGKVTGNKPKRNWRKISFLSAIGFIVLLALYFSLPLQYPFSKAPGKNRLADSTSKQNVHKKVPEKDTVSKSNKSQPKEAGKKTEKESAVPASDNPEKGILEQIQKQLIQIEDSTKKFQHKDLELNQQLKIAKKLTVNSSPEEISESLNGLIKSLEANTQIYKTVNPIIRKLQKLQNQLLKAKPKSNVKAKPDK
jgi:serine/threonine protein phosphatase PrpC